MGRCPKPRVALPAELLSLTNKESNQRNWPVIVSKRDGSGLPAKFKKLASLRHF
jgi:hypothetical protein